MSAKRKTCSLRYLQGGPCRRVALAGIDLCKRHAVALASVERWQADLLDMATEVCVEGVVDGANIAISRDLFEAMCATNERLQSALVALHSRTGRDEDAE
jgi:hypothetical protein